MGKPSYRQAKIILSQKNIAVRDWFLVFSYMFSYTHPFTPPKHITTFYFYNSLNLINNFLLMASDTFGNASVSLIVAV